AQGTLAAANYSFVFQKGTLSVTPAALTVTANNQTKSYGQALNLGNTAFTTSGLINGDTVTGVTLSSTGAAQSAAMGSYDILPSADTGTGVSNYTIIYSKGTLTVGTAALTVTASDQNKSYGQTLALGTTAFTTSGLVTGDTVTGVTLSSAGAAAGAAM